MRRLDHLGYESRADDKAGAGSSGGSHLLGITTVPTPTVIPSRAARSTAVSAPGVSIVTSTSSIPPWASAVSVPQMSPPSWKRTIPSSAADPPTDASSDIARRYPRQ